MAEHLLPEGGLCKTFLFLASSRSDGFACFKRSSRGTTIGSGVNSTSDSESASDIEEVEAVISLDSVELPAIDADDDIIASYLAVLVNNLTSQKQLLVQVATNP